MGSADGLPEFLATRSAEIAETVTDAVARHIVASSPWLTAEHQRRGADRTHMVARVLSLAATGAPFSDDDLLFYDDLGAQFARHGVPLQVLMDVFDVGTAAIAGESWRLAPAGHFADMARFTDAAARMMALARQASVRAYLEADRTGGDARPVRCVLAEALIAGKSALAVAQAANEELAPGYLVMASAVASPAQADALQAPAVARLIEAVPGALYCALESGLVVLLPVRASLGRAEDAASELVDRLSLAAAKQVFAAHAHAPGLASIPASLDEACSALRLAMAIPDARRRPYRLDDLLVELAISRQPDVRRRLAALLTPLEAGADLLRTLEALLAANLDRERAASELCIHRRTLRYRIDRIRELSGIDPDSVHGLQLLRAALTATRLPSQEPQHPQHPQTQGRTVAA